MPRPNLIHPITVFLQKAEKALSLQDDDLHEPIGQVRRQQTPTRFKAQIAWGLDHRLDQANVGTTQDSDGYLLFLTRDLRAARWTLELSDRVTQVGDEGAAQPVDLYLIGLKWMGHYPDQHGASLVRAYFEDRNPARQR